MVLPMSLNEREGRRDDQWINFYLNTFFVLNKGADITKVEAKMKEVYERQAKDQIKEAGKNIISKIPWFIACRACTTCT